MKQCGHDLIQLPGSTKTHRDGSFSLPAACQVGAGEGSTTVTRAFRVSLSILSGECRGIRPYVRSQRRPER